MRLVLWGLVGLLCFQRAEASSSIAGQPIENAELPGLRMPLPVWHVERRDDNFSDGLLSLRGSTSLGVVVRWRLGELTYEERRKEWVAQGASTLVGREQPVTVYGHKGGVIVVEQNGEPHAIEIHWYCPIDKREIRVWIYGKVDEAPFKQLQNEIIAHAICHIPVDASVKSKDAPVFPPFEPPSGYAQVDKQPQFRVRYSNSQHEFFVIRLGERTDILARDMLAVPKLRADKAKIDSNYDSVKVAPEPTDVKGRSIWQATARLRGVKVFEAMTAWYCPNISQSFLAQFVGLSKASADKAAQSLATIACP